MLIAPNALILQGFPDYGKIVPWHMNNILIIYFNLLFITVLGQYPAACSAYKLEAPLLAAGLLTTSPVQYPAVLLQGY